MCTYQLSGGISADHSPTVNRISFMTYHRLYSKFLNNAELNQMTKLNNQRELGRFQIMNDSLDQSSGNDEFTVVFVLSNRLSRGIRSVVLTIGITVVLSSISSYSFDVSIRLGWWLRRSLTKWVIISVWSTTTTRCVTVLTTSASWHQLPGLTLLLFRGSFELEVAVVEVSDAGTLLFNHSIFNLA